MDHRVLPPAPPQHQVFINFRGDELRNNFISHLVDAFQRNEINIFIDKKEQRGQDISILFKRIQQSKIAIAVFSKRYTESRWCLDELVKMKELVDLGNLKVFPIFYNVTTYDVKLIEGEFGIHFRRLEREYRYEKPKIDKWKEALACVSGKIGLAFDDKSLSESDFIGNIIKEILIMLQSIPSLQVQNTLINTLPTKEETSTMKKDSEVENSLINTLPIKEETCTMNNDSKVENSLINTLPIKEETSTMKKDYKKHLKAQKGKLETPPRAIPYGYGPLPAVGVAPITFSRQVSPVRSSNRPRITCVRPSYYGGPSSPPKRSFFKGWFS